MEDHIKYAIIVIVCICVLLILTKLPSNNLKTSKKVTLNQLVTIGSQIKGLFALAKQDSNALLSLLHTNSALNRLHALNQICPENDLSKKLDVDINQWKLEMTRFQQDKFNEVTAACPVFALEYGSSVDLDWSA